MAWLPNHTKRLKLIVDNTNIDDTLTDFPVLVKISESSGISSIDVTDVFTDLNYPSVDDDFTGDDGDAPNTDLWVGDDPYNIASIQSNRLNIASDGVSDQYLYLTSKWKLTGDFDVQVDFDITTLDAPSSSVQYANTLRIDGASSV
ncbi:MAG: hypothetical protein KAJ10_02905, partial [Thermodesulfovibrionia bacterium]|nr:hypothetical protein [Thermodesulfovibrionia bacterium]